MSLHEAMNERPAATIAAQLNRVVAVMTYVRAGSGLMSSLLDSHPNVVTTPDCILMGFYEFWDEHGHLPAHELLLSFVDYYAVLFDAQGKCKCPRAGYDCGEYLNYASLGPNRDECLMVDRDAFKRSMTEIIGDDGPVARTLFFQGIHVAYAQAQGRVVEEPVISFGLHVNRPKSVQAFVEDFPEALFLQMVRHPMQGLGSHFRHHLRSGDLGIAGGVGAIRAAYYYGAPSANHGSSWRGVRLEDLHGSPRETLQKICDWLEITWDDILLESTVNGKQWWNEKNTLQISGLSDAIPAQKFEEYIPRFDRFRLNVLFAAKCKVWDYTLHRWFSTILGRLFILPLLAIPFKMELIAISSATRSPQSERSFPARWVNAVKAIFIGRRHLLGIWLHVFKGQQNNVELL